MLRLRSENRSDGRTWHPSAANAREPAMWEVKLRNAGGWKTAGALAARAATARVNAQTHWQRPIEARDAVRAIVVARRLCQDAGMHSNSFWHQVTLISSSPQCRLDRLVWGPPCHCISECGHRLYDGETTVFTSKCLHSFDAQAARSIFRPQKAVKRQTQSSYLISVKRRRQWQTLWAARGWTSAKGHWHKR